MNSESVCYPAKLSHGHVMNLLDKDIDFIWMPCSKWERQEDEGAGNHFNCPMVTSYPEVIYNNMDVVRQSDINFLNPFINLADKPSFKRQMMKALHDYGFTKTEIDNASEKAFAELVEPSTGFQNSGTFPVIRNLAFIFSVVFLRLIT